MKRIVSFILLIAVFACAFNSCSKNEQTVVVQFNANGGRFELYGSSWVVDVTAKVGECVPFPAEPTRYNYTFRGWCEDASGETLWSPSAKVEKEMTLFAKWEESGEDTTALLSVNVVTDRVSGMSATLWGVVTITGDAKITGYGIEYTGPDGVVHELTPEVLEEDSLRFFCDVTELMPVTDYSCRAFVLDGDGERVESAEKAFKTTGAVWVETDSVNVKNTTIEYWGTAISVKTNVYRCGIVCADLDGGGVHKSYAQMEEGSSSDFYGTISDLTEFTEYACYTYVEDAVGNIWKSPTDTFTTTGKQEQVIWENDGSQGAVSWDGVYRFSNPDAPTGEEISVIDWDEWNVIKNGTFYLQLEGGDPQIRVTTGWWQATWTGEDIVPGNEHLFDLGDNTWTLEVNLEGDPILDLIDAQHLLFTGKGYTPKKLYYYK